MKLSDQCCLQNLQLHVTVFDSFKVKVSVNKILNLSTFILLIDLQVLLILQVVSIQNSSSLVFQENIKTLSSRFCSN